MKARRILIAAACSMVFAACDLLPFLDGEDDPNGDGGSVHTGYITRSETWKAADNPHLVKGAVIVAGDDTPVLTIEAGVVVHFEANAGLRIGDGSPATLKVLGTEEAPVKFVANTAASPGHFVGLILDDGTTPATTLSWLEIESCGADNSGGWNEACLVMTGAGTKPTIDHVTVRKSSAYGVSVEGLASFGAGSTTLVATDSADAGIYVQYPESVGSIPPGSLFEGNGQDVIEIGPQAERIQKSQTWSDFGVPYVVTGNVIVGATPAPTLTIPEGVELRFTPAGALVVGLYDDEPAVLKVLGTEEAPVVFSGYADEPYPGMWGGILLGEYATPASRIDHAIIEYGGIDGSGGGWESYDGDAAIIVVNDKGPIITNTTIRESAGCGIFTVQYDGDFLTDFTDGHGNVFESNANGDQCHWE